MKNVLLLTDFTASAEQAVFYGFQLARQLSVKKVMLCNVMNIPAEIPQFEVPVLPLADYDRVISESQNELQKIKQKLLRRGKESDFYPAIICVEEVGRVTDVVGKLIAEHQIDLVAVGIHTKKGLVEWALGNHVNELIELAQVPVVIIPTETGIQQIQKIAFALDDQAKERNSLSMISALAEKLNAQLFLFHIMDKQVAEPGLYDKFNGTVVAASKGPLEEQLKVLCLAEHIDLLVIMHRNRSFLKAIFLGSHSRKMARKTNIPLLIVPLM